MTVNVLGTEYTVTVKKYDEDKTFAENSSDGYCDEISKQIVICDMTTYPDWEKEPDERARTAEKQTLRHEIVHAFFDESGLSQCSLRFDGAWAKNEEMVDWFALQGPKIYKAWQEANAI